MITKRTNPKKHLVALSCATALATFTLVARPAFADEAKTPETSSQPTEILAPAQETVVTNMPINPRNFRNIVKDTMLVSFAGPATNFLLSIGFAVLLRLLIEFFPLGEWQGNTVWDFFFLMFQTGVVVNIGLGWLNLMPIPPLDGSKILWGVLPPKLGFQYMQLERYGFLVLILLLMTGALGYVLYPLIQFSVNTVFSLIVLS